MGASDDIGGGGSKMDRLRKAEEGREGVGNGI